MRAYIVEEKKLCLYFLAPEDPMNYWDYTMCIREKVCWCVMYNTFVHVQVCCRPRVPRSPQPFFIPTWHHSPPHTLTRSDRHHCTTGTSSHHPISGPRYFEHLNTSQTACGGGTAVQLQCGRPESRYPERRRDWGRRTGRRWRRVV